MLFSSAPRLVDDDSSRPMRARPSLCCALKSITATRCRLSSPPLFLITSLRVAAKQCQSSGVFQFGFCFYIFLNQTTECTKKHPECTHEVFCIWKHSEDGEPRGVVDWTGCGCCWGAGAVVSVTNLFAVWACCAYTNLGSPYPKKHLRRAQSPRRDIDIRTRLHSWNFTIFRFCEGSFAFSARIFFLHHCCPHLLLLFPTLPRQWRFCHGCFSALRVSIYFIFSPPQSTVFFFVRNCGEALQPRRTQVLLQLLRASVSRKTKTKKNNFGISVNKHVVGPKTLSHARLSHYFNQTHLPAPRPTLNK